MGKAKEKLYMPMGVGGLIRYTEEERPVIRIKPKQLIYIIIGIIILEFLLKFFG